MTRTKNEVLDVLFALGYYACVSQTGVLAAIQRLRRRLPIYSRGGLHVSVWAEASEASSDLLRLYNEALASVWSASVASL